MTLKSILRCVGVGASFFAMAIASGCAGIPAANAAPAQDDTIVIANTGSTNFIGYRVAIAPGGNATYVTGSGSGQAMLPKTLFDKLAADVAAAKPLAKLAAGSCMKSASFGSSLYVAAGADRSPDLSCPGNEAAQTLASDVGTVADFLHVAPVLRSQGHPLPPVTP